MKIILEKCLLADQNSLANILIFNFLSQTYLTLSLSQEGCLGFLSLALPAFLSSVIFLSKIRGGGLGPHGPSPRSATALDYLALPFLRKISEWSSGWKYKWLKAESFLGCIKLHLPILGS